MFPEFSQLAKTRSYRVLLPFLFMFPLGMHSESVHEDRFSFLCLQFGSDPNVVTAHNAVTGLSGKPVTSGMGI